MVMTMAPGQGDGIDRGHGHSLWSGRQGNRYVNGLLGGRDMAAGSVVRGKGPWTSRAAARGRVGRAS